jgi:hypothetical protein
MIVPAPRRIRCFPCRRPQPSAPLWGTDLGHRPSPREVGTPTGRLVFPPGQERDKHVVG